MHFMMTSSLIGTTSGHFKLKVVIKCMRPRRHGFYDYFQLDWLRMRRFQAENRHKTEKTSRKQKKQKILKTNSRNRLGRIIWGIFLFFLFFPRLFLFLFCFFSGFFCFSVFSRFSCFMSIFSLIGSSWDAFKLKIDIKQKQPRENRKNRKS